ncbi:uncharacterized protein BO97DRAFT_420219 [Aspergillus homomorphus CBS 101889]|uniref:Uncharacterized protein n=1 Tax=Aspergillus homomorphus (strain CBS 101889) TaxID=1450537 RepID=A0A395ICJ0_ASPHC|nr:hypothetical protein BO97DRAFT_420219 [Aspergillus homomorphus CBS 101889]RAL16828.1 hypothetical protein BO97DRAFT_420219 [Aspergillus homomorphus CBS 101889]
MDCIFSDLSYEELRCSALPRIGMQTAQSLAIREAHSATKAQAVELILTYKNDGNLERRQAIQWEAGSENVCLASTISPADPVPPKSAKKDVQHQQKQTLNSYFESLTSGCRRNVNNNSPNPLPMSERLQRNVAKLHEALVTGLSSIVDTWWTDEQAAFPQRMPLEPHEEDLLRWLHEQSQANNLRPFEDCQGHWRSDLLLPSDHPGTVAICEINARYSINAQLLAAYGYQIYEEMAWHLKEAASLQVLTRRRYVTSPLSLLATVDKSDDEQFVKSQLDLFDPKYPVHIVRDQYRTPFIEMFVSFAKQNGGVDATINKPTDPRLIKSKDSKAGYVLYCLSDRDCSDMVSTDGERLDRVYQTGLHLFQHELRSIPIDILRHLTLHCVNDMRSVPLIHDKRILGVLLQELDSLVGKNVLTAEQAAVLRHGVVPNINPGSPELNELIGPHI